MGNFGNSELCQYDDLSVKWDQHQVTFRVSLFNSHTILKKCVSKILYLEFQDSCFIGQKYSIKTIISSGINATDCAIL